jgi:hypothetical protein
MCQPLKNISPFNDIDGQLSQKIINEGITTYSYITQVISYYTTKGST